MSEKPTDTCGPCRAGLHERCYEPCLCRDRGHPIETLTPAEVALARVLAVLESYPEPARLADGRVAGYRPESGRMWGVACAVGEDLWDRSAHALTRDGRTLLDRARKAGVL